MALDIFYGVSNINKKIFIKKVIPGEFLILSKIEVKKICRPQ